MDAQSGSAPDHLIDRLIHNGHAFDFFQAVRQLECANRTLPRIGQSLRPEKDPVRFGQLPSLAFAPSTIAQCTNGSPEGVVRVLVYFFGLLGPNGPMPHHLTAYIRERQLHPKDFAPAAFLDILHHRFVSLFYRAWASGKQTVQRDRPGEDRIASYLASLVGINLNSLRQADTVPDEAKLYYSGRLTHRASHAEGLEAIVSDYFAVSARVEQFIGQWIELPPDSCCALGASTETGVVGKSLVIGTHIWSRQHKFRLILGPLTFPDLCRFLPKTKGFCRLVDWVRNYLGDQLDWDVRLILQAQEVPRTQLGKLGKLGWTTWLTTKKVHHDRGDVVLRPFAA